MKVTVYDQQGKAHILDDEKAGTLMELIRAADLPIAAQCGGSCACATCHVYIDPAWLPRLTPAEEHEAAMLEFAEDATPNSRLSCQIPAGKHLDGLVVRLAPGA